MAETSSSGAETSERTDGLVDPTVKSDGPNGPDVDAPDQGAGAEPVGFASVRRFLPILVVFAVLFGGYQLLLRSVLSPAVYSENPAQSSLINIQGGLFGDDEEVALVGSSISARLLTDFFAERGVPVVGLALDAQGPALGIDLLADADRLPGTVMVEINRSLYSSSSNEQTIIDTVGSTGFDLAREVPGLRAESRPSSVLYTELKQQKDGAGAPDAGDGFVPEIFTVTEDPGFDPTSLTEEQREGVARVTSSLDEAASAGACLVFFIAPDRGFAGPAEQAFADHLSFTYGAPVVDLRAVEDQIALGYTDHIHLDIPSARLVSHVLADAMLGFEADNGCPQAG